MSHVYEIENANLRDMGIKAILRVTCLRCTRTCVRPIAGVPERIYVLKAWGGGRALQEWGVAGWGWGGGGGSTDTSLFSTTPGILSGVKVFCEWPSVS